MNALAIPPRTWTPELVEERLADALRALRDLPALGCFPAGYRSTMPSPLQRWSDWIEVGSETFQQDLDHLHQQLAEEGERKRPRPSAERIGAMEEALGWQRFVEPREHFVAVAAKLLGEAEKATAKRFHVTRMTLWRWRESAVQQIVERLNLSAPENST